MASVSLEHIYKKFPSGYEAVRDLDIEIADKEFICFVGPAGSGKSTALRMIAGLEEISSGTLRIDGEVVNDVEARDRGIAMLFQNNALYPQLTVYDNMAFGLKIRKVPREEIDRRVRATAEDLGLTEILDRKPKALSAGQKHRVVMGRAIVRDPRVFLLDEPLINFDERQRDRLRDGIVELHERLHNTTVIYVAHDQTEAMALADRIVVMKDGAVQQIDTPQNLYDKPCNVFVAGFMGSPQMNFIEGTVRVQGAKAVLRIAGTDVPLNEAKSKALIDGGYAGKTIMAGIRPEDIIDLDEPASPEEAVFKARVNACRDTDDYVFLHFEIKDTPFMARVAKGTKAGLGDTVRFCWNTDKVHLFDKETERAICV